MAPCHGLALPTIFDSVCAYVCGSPPTALDLLRFTEVYIFRGVALGGTLGGRSCTRLSALRLETSPTEKIWIWDAELAQACSKKAFCSSIKIVAQR